MINRNNHTLINNVHFVHNFFNKWMQADDLIYTILYNLKEYMFVLCTLSFADRISERIDLISGRYRAREDVHRDAWCPLD